MRILPTIFSLVLGLACLSGQTWAGALRTQTIRLQAGWNAVFLEVQPVSAKIGDVFANLPVASVACFLPGQLGPQYLRNPGDAPWREEGWAIWHAPSRPEAFLSTLFEVQALRPLLVLATADVTWTVTGEARANVITWYPNTCTFTGLPVDPAAPPTFAQFFSGSKAHQRLRVFRLTDGAWKLVAAPTRDVVRSGEAYWIQTDGASTYQGPLRVKLPAIAGVDFDLRGSGYTFEFLNDAPNSTAKLKIETRLESDALLLGQVTRDLTTLTTQHLPLAPSLNLQDLAPGGTATLRIEPLRDALKSERGSTLVKITDGRGSLLWVPVSARRLALSRAAGTP